MALQLRDEKTNPQSSVSIEEGEQQPANQQPSRLQETQKKVDEVIEKMRYVKDKQMAERSEMLAQLEQHSSYLEAESSSFAKTTREVSKQMWWEDCWTSYKICIIIGILALLLTVAFIVLVWILGKVRSPGIHARYS